MVKDYDFRGSEVMEWEMMMKIEVKKYIIEYEYLEIMNKVGKMKGEVRFMMGYERKRKLRMKDIR